MAELGGSRLALSSGKLNCSRKFLYFWIPAFLPFSQSSLQFSTPSSWKNLLKVSKRNVIYSIPPLSRFWKSENSDNRLRKFSRSGEEGKTNEISSRVRWKKRIWNNGALLLLRKRRKKEDFGNANNPMLPPPKNVVSRTYFSPLKIGRKNLDSRGWMNEFPPRALGCLSFPAKWHGTRFVSGELDRIEIPLYVQGEFHSR